MKSTILAFIDRQREAAPNPIGRYRYSPVCHHTTLYSSCYAAMSRHLLGDTNTLMPEERAEWIAYLQAHQDDDGLFRDEVIFNQSMYENDPLWCGRSHLTCHVIAALACLGGAAEKPLRWLRPWLNPDGLIRWLEERDWGERVGWTGNEIMNVGTLLQYARDFQNDGSAEKAVNILLDWLSGNRINPETGVWGDVDVGDPLWRSHAVQAAYHWWPLFFYDGRPIPHLERAIDTLMATQNPNGGFGWGVHNPNNRFMSSACEDIDSIDPLCRMMQLTDYRRTDIQAALTKAVGWVLTNQMPDGGFVFMRDRPFIYGHSQLRGEANQGAMFPTWFRLLSLALMDRVLTDRANEHWQFVRCPGMQFWGHPGHGKES